MNSNSFIELIIILGIAQVLVNFTIVMLSQPVLLAWFNQAMLGIYSIAVLSYLVLKRCTKETCSNAGGAS